MRCHMPCHDKYAIQRKNPVKSCSHSACHAFPCRKRCRAGCALKNCCKNREADCKLYLFNIHTTTRREQLRAAVESTPKIWMKIVIYMHTNDLNARFAFGCHFYCVRVQLILKHCTGELVKPTRRQMRMWEETYIRWQICWVMVNRSDRIFTVCAVQWPHWLCRTVNGGNVRCHLCTRFATNERTARCGLFAEINGH